MPARGKIYEICAQLGHGSIAKSSPRYCITFQAAIREDWKKNYLEPNGFPKSVAAEEVRSFALNICINDQIRPKPAQHFPDDEEAHQKGFVWLPRDQEKIVALLSEMLLKIAQNYCNSTAKGLQKYKVSSDRQKARGIDETFNSENKRLKQEICESEDLEYPVAKTLSASSKRERDIQFNIDEALRFTYPIPKVESSYSTCDISGADPNLIQSTQPSIGWIFQVGQLGQWPPEPTAFAWRLMHDKNMYSSHPKPTDIGYLASNLEGHLQIICDQGQFFVMNKRCEGFIVQWSKRWYRECGLLQDDGAGNLQRTAAFDTALVACRRDWNALPSTAAFNSVELEHRDLQVALRDDDSQKQKNYTRASFDGLGPFGGFGDDDDLANGSRSVRACISEPLDDQSRMFANTRSSSYIDDEVMGSQVSVPRSSPLTPSAQGYREALQPGSRHIARTTSPDTELEVVSPSTNPRSSRSGLRNRDGLKKYNRNASPEEIVKPGRATKYRRQTKHTKAKPKTIAIKKAVPSKNKSDFKTSLGSHSLPLKAGTTSSSETPKINFILQCADGKLDFKRPLTGIKDMTVDEIFERYAQQSSLDVKTLHVLKFIVVFSSHTEIEVQRGNSVTWGILKQRIGNLFKLTRKQEPEEVNFEVWVMSDQKVITVEESEDDGL